MKILAEISDRSLGIDPNAEIVEHTFRVRKSARCVLLNEAGEVSLQHVRKKGFYKLPGGGVEPGETEEEALRREVIEEVGCAITDIQELGVVMQYFNRNKLLHIAYGYLARVEGGIGEPCFEEGELADGMKPVWCSLEKAQERINPDTVRHPYEGQFIVRRERILLDAAAQFLEK